VREEKERERVSERVVNLHRGDKQAEEKKKRNSAVGRNMDKHKHNDQCEIQDNTVLCTVL
jgi:hypothetical protein